MTQVSIIQDNDVLHYDPNTDNYPAAIWQTEQGSPSVTSGQLVLNSAEIIGTRGVTNGTIEMFLNFPVDPTAGQDKKVGFASSKDDNGRIEFVISGSNFKAQVYDDVGNELLNRDIIWDNSWSGSKTLFSIHVGFRHVTFAAEDNIVGEVYDVDVPDFSKVPRLLNNNSDDLKLDRLSLH